MKNEFSVITRARELFERVTFNQAEAQSRARALEAAMRFAGQPNQESKATFVADSEALFDLNGLHTGSIFRVRYEGQIVHKYLFHKWYVAGEKTGRVMHLYEINNFYATHHNNISHVRLIFTPDLSVTQVYPRQPVFPVGEACEALGGERHDNMFSVSQIDLMYAGVNERGKETKGVGVRIVQIGQGVLAY